MAEGSEGGHSSGVQDACCSACSWELRGDAASSVSEDALEADAPCPQFSGIFSPEQWAEMERGGWGREVSFGLSYPLEATCSPRHSSGMNVPLAFCQWLQRWSPLSCPHLPGCWRTSCVSSELCAAPRGLSCFAITHHGPTAMSVLF